MGAMSEYAMTHGSEQLLKQAEDEMCRAHAEANQLRNAVLKLEEKNLALRECLLDAMQDFDETAPWVSRARQLTE